MNVTKCMNGHFFDADKYNQCPHCGAVSIMGRDSSKTAEAKRSHAPFFGKKKPEADYGNIVEMPEGTIGKTFGLFDTDESADDQENIVTVAVRESYNSDEKPSDFESYKAPFAVETEKNDSDEPEGRLQDAVKKAVSSDDGKTVGFFGIGAEKNEAPIDSEPVVGWLVCVKGKHFGESFNIFAGRNAVGRSDSNKIVLAKDTSVSRNKHVWLTYEPKKREFFIQPGEGSGLSYLNGENVMESMKLQAKDVLEFGSGRYILIPLCGEDFTWEDYMDKE